MKTVLTLGPATETKPLITHLSQTADRFRLNVAHLTAEGLKTWLERLAEIFTEQGKALPLVLDLQGAKMRIGNYPSCDDLPSEIRLVFGHSSNHITQVPIPHQTFFQELKIGDKLSLNDARIQLEVIEIQDKSATANVITNGELSSYKGINRVDHPVPFTQLSQHDQRAVELGLRYPFVQFACSFVLDGKEVTPIRQQIGDRYLIAKIERPEAMSYLSQLDQGFDELWFCRGDLGAQVGCKALGQLQAAFIAQFPQLSRPKFLAGQVLEYMTHFPQPTRTEVVHLYDIQQAGFDGIVLSDETAIGRYPAKVADFLAHFYDQ
ncbi:pyruvate kinase [Coleofasciculus sp. G2-EDA-02]|uniref:pyruvate kinase n=1 Tax=Coleofasciculus sp. G2-EDA-02 TaxID=3069529 RepID=UPI0032F73AAE